MKKSILLIACLVILSIWISARPYSTTDHAAATVNQVEGILIFTDSKPVDAYDYLGSVNVLTMNGYYGQIRSACIKQAKKKYPTTEGLIINTEDGKADAIKFK